ncbi:MAG: hypothetical protein HC925_06875 [Coleofasciculaceae cyanobacterium SM2_3_26]|nr:hypothetical protein [Coleofasciculaceae cyanobacterium SM2_3_26]
MAPSVEEILSTFEHFSLNNPVGDRYFQVDRNAYIFADDDYNRMILTTPIYNQRVPSDRIQHFNHARESSNEKSNKSSWVWQNWA